MWLPCLQLEIKIERLKGEEPYKEMQKRKLNYKVRPYGLKVRILSLGFNKTLWSI